MFLFLLFLAASMHFFFELGRAARYLGLGRVALYSRYLKGSSCSAYLITQLGPFQYVPQYGLFISFCYIIVKPLLLLAPQWEKFNHRLVSFEG